MKQLILPLHNMKKLITVLTTIILSSLFSPNLVKAEATITEGDLQIHFLDPIPQHPHPDPSPPPNEIGAIWYELNIAPGDSFTRQIEVTNIGEDVQELGVHAVENETVKNLSEVLDIAITGGITDYNGSLSELFNEGEFIIDFLTPSQTKTYTMTVTFDEDAGNEYMSASTVFDYLIGFEGDVMGESTQAESDTGDILGVTGKVIIGGVLIGTVLLIIILGKFVSNRLKK